MFLLFLLLKTVEVENYFLLLVQKTNEDYILTNVLLMLKVTFEMCRLCLSIHSVCLKIVICYYLNYKKYSTAFICQDISCSHFAMFLLKNNYHYYGHNTLIILVLYVFSSRYRLAKL